MPVRQPELDSKIQAWIEALTDRTFDSGKSYEDNLKDGVLICHLMNKLQPNSIPKIEEAGSPFKLRQNIDKFQTAIKKYGVATEQVFQTVDLFERKNIPQVTACLFELSRQAKLKGFSGPFVE
ncbi:hypothetical protein GJ496_000785 [Pomphorhynchus laevis]|nr:hypothetical protein GJ496_000785 [Pomphorhynchus laevis]